MYAPDGEVVLALRILRTFNFSHHVLTTFVKEAVVPLLSSDSDELREVCALIVSDNQYPFLRHCLIVVTRLQRWLVRTQSSRNHPSSCPASTRYRFCAHPATLC